MTGYIVTWCILYIFIHHLQKLPLWAFSALTTNSNSLASTVFLKKITFHSLQHLCRRLVGYCYLQHPLVGSDLRPEGQVEQFKLKEAAPPPPEISAKRLGTQVGGKDKLLHSSHDFLLAHRTQTRISLFPTALPDRSPEPHDKHKDLADLRRYSMTVLWAPKAGKGEKCPDSAFSQSSPSCSRFTAKALSHLVDL